MLSSTTSTPTTFSTTTAVAATTNTTLLLLLSFSTLYSVSMEMRAIYGAMLDRSSAPCLEHQFERNISHEYLCIYYLRFRSPFTKANSVISCELLMAKKCLARQLARSCCSFVCYVVQWHLCCMMV